MHFFSNFPNAHNSNYPISQRVGATVMLQVGTSLKNSQRKEPPPPHTHTHTHTHRENGLRKEKQDPSKGEKRDFTWRKKHSIVVSRGVGRSSTLAPLLRAPMSECDYIKYTMFSEIIHYIIISKYTLECTQLNYLVKIFSEVHTIHCRLNTIFRRRRAYPRNL